MKDQKRKTQLRLISLNTHKIVCYVMKNNEIEIGELLLSADVVTVVGN
jgi:hypothetical protein